MSEYDDRLVYVPLEDLQRIGGMDNRVNAMQIKLKDGVRKDSRYVHGQFVPSLQALMPMPEARVQSWWQQQGPLLAAIDIERGILNLLLFLIVGVAGFGVLAIFSMIVSEKYRDIGVMKSLGASSGGVMSIFLGYGLAARSRRLWLLGTVLGAVITENINPIEACPGAAAAGTQVFDRERLLLRQHPDERRRDGSRPGQPRGDRHRRGVQRPAGPAGGPAAPGAGAAIRVRRTGDRGVRCQACDT